jgi:hypothetical protein
MEALEANMWPIMTFKTQQRPVKTEIVEVNVHRSFCINMKGIEEVVEITHENKTVIVSETVVATAVVQVEEEPTKVKLSKTERRERAIQRELQEKAKQVKIQNSAI